MKKLILLFIIVNISCLYSQNREPAQVQLNIDTSLSQPNVSNWFLTYINSDMEYFKMNDFMLGWHWGNGRKMTEAMRMNQAHLNCTYDTGAIASNTNLIINANSITSMAEGTNIMQAQAVQYEPTLKIDNPEQLKTNINDPTNPVFGFRYINTKINNIGTTKRLVLKKDDGYMNEVVLSNPWINDALYFNSEI